VDFGPRNGYRHVIHVFNEFREIGINGRRGKKSV